MNYIDADRLRAEIVKWYNAYKIGQHSAFRNGKVEALRETIELIEHLQQEQPEVDLEKETNAWLDSGTYTIRETARHFYELGLNARNEDF